MRLCTGRTAYRGSRGIALPFRDHGTRRGWGVSVTLWPFFTPAKTRYPLYRRLGGPQGRSRSVQVRKISPPPRFDPRTVQPVASRYADWLPGPLKVCGNSIKQLHTCVSKRDVSTLSLSFVYFKASKTLASHTKKEERKNTSIVTFAIVVVPLKFLQRIHSSRVSGAAHLVWYGQNVCNPEPYCKLHLVRFHLKWKTGSVWVLMTVAKCQRMCINL